MSAIEWVSLSIAVERLRTLWGLPDEVCEQILRNVIHGGHVDVRGVPRYELVPQIITEQIRTSLLPNVLAAVEWDSIEIEWTGLLDHGRKLVPSWARLPQSPAKKEGSPPKRRRVEEALRALYGLAVPDQKDLSNDELCKAVCEKIERDNKEKGYPKILIGKDTILRAADRR
jgi:hypothetical protein